jgi:predicted membrane-bound spermidine synthase
VTMNDAFGFLGALAVWILLQYVVLPRLGVPT